MFEHNRARAVDRHFREKVRAGDLPELPARRTPEAVGLRPEEVLDLFESQILSRLLDLLARELRARGEGFYTIASAGHEGNAAFGKAFRFTDPAFLHYRSGALVIQRAKQRPGTTPLYDALLGLVASAEDPVTGGRHKVWGSVSLHIPPQTSTIASHLPKAVGAALALPRAQSLGLPTEVPYDSVVLCSFGDASINHATALAGLNAARWCAYRGLSLPLVFLCEDNGLGISVSTPEGWVAAAQGHGLKYLPCDGRDVLDVYRAARAAAAYARQRRRPAFVHMKTVRLLGHAGTDVEVLYHTPRQIEAAEADDPLLHTARLVLERGFLRPDQVVDLYEGHKARLRRIAEEAVRRPKLARAAEVMRPIVPPPRAVSPTTPPAPRARRRAFGAAWALLKKPQHMARLLNWALRDALLQYPQLLVFGEDVGKRGGVYNVTAGLQKAFGPRRVFDTVLDETTILGTAIGLAQQGFLPVPEIQFLAYVHNAQDQLRGEAATLSFFSNGRYANPMVVRIAGLAYQKGFGGHFHNDNSLAVFRDVPGLILAVPAQGADAVRMLRRCLVAAHRERRVVVFVEPIALYMTKDLYAPGDGGWQFPYPPLEESCELGEIGLYGEGKDLALVSYGNGLYLSLQAARQLEEAHGLRTRVIDLRWLAPLPEETLLEALRGCEHVLVVDEGRRSGSPSEALLTLFLERLDPLPRLARLTGEDTFIPLGPAAELVLPSRQSIVRAALALVGASVHG